MLYLGSLFKTQVTEPLLLTVKAIGRLQWGTTSSKGVLTRGINYQEKEG